jgi:pSer/pThr/pTyr-binding forkhead associated (FHA) protein
MVVANCPTCGIDNADDSNYCRRCGSRLTPVDLSETTITWGPVDGAGLETESESTGETEGSPALLVRALGGREGEVISLAAEVLTIGRSPHSDIFLDDVTVSRHHARVIRDESGFLIEDLNSLNGSYVNRKRVERHRLSDGDELQIGKYKLVFLQPSDDTE